MNDQGCRKVKKIGGASCKGWAESAPLDVIGLTDLPSWAPGTPNSGIPAVSITSQVATTPD